MHTVRREASTVDHSIELPALLWKAAEVSVYVHGAAFHRDVRECGVLVFCLFPLTLCAVGWKAFRAALLLTT